MRPRYEQLPVVEGKPPRSTWGMWGDDDSIGAINFLGPRQVLDGLSTVRDGTVFPLNWDIEMPSPPFFGRKALRHEIDALNPHAFDDHYDRFYPQASSQWDALSHVGHPEYGYYNGRTGADFTGRAGAKNGIEQWARRGIVSRGVLLDIPRWFAERGVPYTPCEKVDIEVRDLEGAALLEGLELREGDVLLVRTGWLGWYRDRTDPALRAALANPDGDQLQIAGLGGSQDIARWVWDSGAVAVATDNPTFESWPRQMVVGDYLHFEILALLGMPIGELFDLDALAAACADDGRYEFLFTSAPLNKVGGIGSPPNALAIR